MHVVIHIVIHAAIYVVINVLVHVVIHGVMHVMHFVIYTAIRVVIHIVHVIIQTCVAIYAWNTVIAGIARFPTDPFGSSGTLILRLSTLCSSLTLRTRFTDGTCNAQYYLLDLV